MPAARLPQHARLRLGVPAKPEVRPPRDERDDDDSRHDRAFVEATPRVEAQQECKQHDGDLPRASAAARQAPRGDEEGGGDRHDDGFRKPVNMRRIEHGEELVAVLREDGVDGGQQADPGHEPRQHEPGTRSPGNTVPAERRPRESGENRGYEHRLLDRSRPERLMCRNLADDEDREAVQPVEPGTHGRPEQKTGREAVGAGPARQQPEQERGCAPDEEVEDERHAGAARQLVERKRIAHCRARQRGDGAHHVEPAGRGEEDAERQQESRRRAGGSSHA